MDDSFILDQFHSKPRGILKAPRLESHIRNNLSAKRFRIDAILERRLVDLVSDPENLKVWESMRSFAKPPFPSVFVEFSAPRPVGADGIVSLKSSILVVGNRCTLMSIVEKETLSIAPYEVYLTDEGFETVSIFPAEKMEKEWNAQEMMTAQESCIEYAGIIEILWLILHRPGAVKSQEVKGRQKVVKGKLRPARAHTVLTIDLAAKDIVKKIMADGSRGSGVREHEVRGTWVHLNHVRSCIHQWERVERPEFAPERWVCPCCATMRVWRKDHVRGEHKRGNVFHTYEVKDSRLEKAA